MNSEENFRWRVWLWSYAPLFVWIGVIFFLSSNLGSAAHTSLVIDPLLKYFFPDMSEVSRDLVHFYVRKTAHFTEYGILALLGIRTLVQTSGMLFRLRWLLPVIIVALVASLDEFNQSFEPSRTSSVWDVLLDCFGGISAVLVCYAIWRLKYDRRPRLSSTDH